MCEQVQSVHFTSTMSVLQSMWMLDGGSTNFACREVFSRCCTRPQCFRFQPSPRQQQGQRKEGSWKTKWRKEECEVLQAANEALRS